MIPKPTASGLPYSVIRQAGDFYFISGHIGMDMVAKTAESDVPAQTTKLFDNLADSLQDADLRMNDIIKTTVFLTDMGDFPAFNTVYASYFGDPKPARSTVAVRELPRIANVPLVVELEAVAYKRSS